MATTYACQITWIGFLRPLHAKLQASLVFHILLIHNNPSSAAVIEADIYRYVQAEMNFGYFLQGGSANFRNSTEATIGTLKDYLAELAD